VNDAPRVFEATLSWDRVDDLLADLAAAATVEEVLMKGGAEARAHGATSDLAAVRKALSDGRITGAQIRYLHEGVRWTDTLLRAGDGVRLVRARSRYGEAVQVEPS